MEHSPNFEKVKRYYSVKAWNLSRVKNAVKMNWITPEEFEEITGKTYTS